MSDRSMALEKECHLTRSIAIILPIKILIQKNKIHVIASVCISVIIYGFIFPNVPISCTRLLEFHQHKSYQLKVKLILQSIQNFCLLNCKTS